MASPVKGIYVAELVAGFVLAWSGIKGATLQETLKDLLKGVNPAKVTEAPPTIGLASADSSASSGGTGSGTLPPTLKNVKGDYSNAQLRSLWILAGGNPSKAAVAACIAQHESSGNAKVTSANPDGGTNVGLWQLDTRGKGAGYSVAQLQNPLTNARVAVKGSSNGSDWSAWATAPACGV